MTVAFLLGLPAANLAAVEFAIVQQTLQSHCVECHDGDDASGKVDLAALTRAFDPDRDGRLWLSVERALATNRMPPEDAEPLPAAQRASFATWFHDAFVMPGGVQRAGPRLPRRLTREELQNTLEDLLHVDLRAVVTNSRLHVIPETIVEKFLPPGVVGASGFSNDAQTLAQESIDIQSYASCFKAAISLVDSDAEAQQSLFGWETAPEQFEPGQAKRILDRFATAAFRRPVTEVESSSLLRSIERFDGKPIAALKAAMLTTLLSPAFLFRFEEPSDAEQSQVSGAELAVRLSYFLWSAPPDEELASLAASGELVRADKLRTQVQRMLADPRRIALSENLGGEWFDYKRLRRASLLNQRSDRMAGFYRTQYEEAALFFDGLIQYDRPVFEIVDAEWAFLNRHQAGIYGVAASDSPPELTAVYPPARLHYRSLDQEIAIGNYEYKHQPLKAMKLDTDDRGGFVTLGATLSVTSSANRTSPIRRGVWVMERILGRHFEVPDDVPDLEETRQRVGAKKHDLDENELLRLHSSQESCATCHQYIDPVGFGLEQYDQLGIRRKVEPNSSTGEEFQWAPETTPADFVETTWDLEQPLQAGQVVQVLFRYTKGANRLDVRNVRLELDGQIVADEHFGFAGMPNQRNVWRLQLPASSSADGWKLKAEIRGGGGTDSSGTIIVGKESFPLTTHVLPNGEVFSTPAQLKKKLLTHYRDAIVDNAIRRVLAYALGRELHPFDRPAIAEIRSHVEHNDYRMAALLEAVVMSYPFQHKEN